MKPELRKHSCKLGIDHEKKWILCAPEDGTREVVLTTAVLYAWHAHRLTTLEGIRQGPFIKAAGYTGKDLVITLLDNFRIVFVNCKEIFVYGLILNDCRDTAIFAFDKNSTKTVQGSPFLFRKTAFLSHASVDKVRVRDLASRLERTIDIWFDEKNISVGDSITERIDSGLQSCDALILCLSKNSIDSPWVKREYTYALHKGLKLLPVRLDDCSPPPTLSDTKYIDFFENEEACVAEIFRSVEQSAR